MPGARDAENLDPHGGVVICYDDDDDDDHHHHDLKGTATRSDSFSIIP